MSLTHSHFRADSDMNNHKYLYGWRARPCSVIAVSAVSAVIAVVTSEMCPAGISAHLTQCTQSSSSLRGKNNSLMANLKGGLTA